MVWGQGVVRRLRGGLEAEGWLGEGLRGGRR